MIRRFYVHNFRCLENFELPISGLSSVLLIGKNGSGKTTVGMVLEIFQMIGQGQYKVDRLVKPKNLARGRMDVPMRFEIELELEGKVVTYTLALEYLSQSDDMRVLEEKLSQDGQSVFVRERKQLTVLNPSVSIFNLSPTVVSLAVVDDENGPVTTFKTFLKRILVLRPDPPAIDGLSDKPSLAPDITGMNFGAWFSEVTIMAPAAYSRIDSLLRQVMPDFDGILNPLVGREARSLEVHFANDHGKLVLPFKELSDGEKIFMIWALTIASNRIYGPLICFWDEPDNYLGLSEIQHFIVDLLKSFEIKGQIIITSHNAETIRVFPAESTIYLRRTGHLEPSQLRNVTSMSDIKDLVSSMILGDLD